MFEYLLSAKRNLWNELAPLPWLASHTDAIVHNGVIYTAGGLSQTNTCMNDFGVYNLETDSWVSLAPLPNRVRGGSMFAKGDYIYYIGGVFQGTGQATIQYRDVLVYKISENRWSVSATQLPTFNSEAGYFQVDDNTGLIFGGQAGAATSMVDYTVTIGDGDVSFTISNPHTGFSIRRAKPIEINGELYFCGGNNASNNPVNTFIKYNLSTKVWTQLSVVPISTNSVVMVEKDGDIHAYVTYTPVTGYRNIEYIYNIESNTWVTGEYVPGRVNGLTEGVTYNGVAYCPGGFDGRSRVSNFRFYTPYPEKNIPQ